MKAGRILPAKSDIGAQTSSASTRVAKLSQAGIGLVPIVGAALIEVVSELVPNQRVDRIEGYLKILEQEIARVSEGGKAEAVASAMTQPIGIALIEDGATVSARMISEDRRNQIAKLVAAGVAQEFSDTLTSQRILALYSELDDGDVALLVSWALPMGATWKLIPERRNFENQDDYYIAHSLHEASIKKLERLGLLSFSARRDIGKDSIKFNQFSGRPEGYHLISALGRAMLMQLGLAPPPIDQQQDS